MQERTGDQKAGDEEVTNWISTTQSLPETGVVVDTKIDNEKGCRNETKLMRQGNLWFFPDGSMYVYYTPTHWKDHRND